MDYVVFVCAACLSVPLSMSVCLAGYVVSDSVRGFLIIPLCFIFDCLYLFIYSLYLFYVSILLIPACLYYLLFGASLVLIAFLS